MKLLKKLAMVMAAVLVAVTPLQVHAEELPDLKKTGSITVTLKDGDTPVGGEELTLVKVASAITKNDGNDTATDRGYAFECTDAFKAEENLVNGLTADNAADTAKNLYAYVAKANAEKVTIAGTAMKTGADGVASFSGLSTGLYLIWNSKPSEQYQTIDPFLVTIPVKNADESGTITYTYDVDAAPKMEKLAEFKPIVVSDPPVQKVITGDNPSKTDRFFFTLRRLDPNSPLPANDNGHVVSIDGDTMTLYADGAEKVEVGTLTFTEEGDYYYEVSEVNSGLDGYTYDSTVYWYKYEIRRDEAGKALTAQRLLIRTGGSEGTTDYDGDANGTAVFTFTNAFQSKGGKKNTSNSGSNNETTNGGIVPKTPSEITPAEPASVSVEPAAAQGGEVTQEPGARLPQTGQLWWPVILMAAAGVICITSGILVGAGKRRNRTSDTQNK